MRESVTWKQFEGAHAHQSTESTTMDVKIEIEQCNEFGVKTTESSATQTEYEKSDSDRLFRCTCVLFLNLASVCRLCRLPYICAAKLPAMR